MPDLHDTIEQAVPFSSAESEDGVTHTACSVAVAVERALADAGLLAPEPHVITSVKELEALPIQTVIRVESGSVAVRVTPNYWYLAGVIGTATPRDAWLPATVLTPAPAPRQSSEDPIPRYAQLDIWMALHGSARSEEYEPYRDEHGFAETWAMLCQEVRNRRPRPSSEDEVEAVAKALGEAFNSGTLHRYREVAEVAIAAMKPRATVTREQMAEMLGIHRWKSMSSMSLECECGVVVQGTWGADPHPADKAFRLHLADEFLTMLGGAS